MIVVVILLCVETFVWRLHGPVRVPGRSPPPNRRGLEVGGAAVQRWALASFSHVYKAVGAGGGPGSDRLDGLVFKVCFTSFCMFFDCFFFVGTKRCKTGSRVRLGDPGFADTLGIYVSPVVCLFVGSTNYCSILTSSCRRC